jgi:hypothetical protein
VVVFAGACGEETCVHLGLCEEVTVMSFLVLEGFDEGAKGLIGLAAMKLFYTEGLATGANEVKGGRGGGTVEDGRAVGGVVPGHEMVLAFC